jgi:hypothetical protein
MRLCFALITGLHAVLLAGLTCSAESPGIPQLARQAMAYRVGNWESVAFVDGVEQSDVGRETTKWGPEKYCITITDTFVFNGVDIHATGLVGWDPQRKQLVEHWYSSDGAYATFCYSLDKKKDAWVGTFKRAFADGTIHEGESVVEIKGEDEWEWHSSYPVDGKTHTISTKNRRVK